MLIVRFCFKACCYLLVLLLAGLWLKPHASFTHNTVNSTLWQTDTSRLTKTVATTRIIKSDHGQFIVDYVATLKGISPRQLIWFIQNQAQHTAKFNDTEWQWFQLSHPFSNSELAIIESPEPTSDRLVPGTTFEELKLLDESLWRMQLRVKSFGEQGMTFDVLHAGYRVGELNYVFYPFDGGTKITFNGQLGLNLPLIGDISNFYLFKKVMPEHLLEAWLLNNLESYQHMETLIPILHQQKLHQQKLHQQEINNQTSQPRFLIS